MKELLISVITASYNSEKTIARTIESVLNQDFDNFEYIVIDGNSKDSTLEIIKSYIVEFKRKKIAFKFISQDDSGIYEAWNKGLALAEGAWISFLGSDDIYLENALNTYYAHLARGTENIDLVYSIVEVMRSNIVVKTIDGTWEWRIFKKYMNIAHVGALHSSALFQKYGVFDQNFKICGDYELLLRAKNNLKTLKIPQVTAQMDSGGVSNNMVAKAFSETYRAKYKTAGINKVQCTFDYLIAWLKFTLKKQSHATN